MQIDCFKIETFRPGFFYFRYWFIRNIRAKKKEVASLFLFRYLLLICIDYSINFIPKSTYHTITVAAQYPIVARAIAIIIRVTMTIFHKKAFPSFKIFLFSNHSLHLYGLRRPFYIYYYYNIKICPECQEKFFFTICQPKK